MKVFDLVFIIAFLTIAVRVVLAVINLVRGRTTQVNRLLVRTGIGLGVYFAVLVIVSLATPQQYYAMGEAQCSDDWCIVVNAADRSASGVSVSYTLSSKARRILQRELHVVSRLVDDRGRRYDAAPNLTDVPFDTLLGPSQSIPATRRYSVPADAHIVGVVVTRDGSGRFPGCCIIGDNGSFLHRPAMVRIGGV